MNDPDNLPTDNLSPLLVKIGVGVVVIFALYCFGMFAYSMFSLGG